MYKLKYQELSKKFLLIIGCAIVTHSYIGDLSGYNCCQCTGSGACPTGHDGASTSTSTSTSWGRRASPNSDNDCKDACAFDANLQKDYNCNITAFFAGDIVNHACIAPSNNPSNNTCTPVCDTQHTSCYNQTVSIGPTGHTISLSCSKIPSCKSACDKTYTDCYSDCTTTGVPNVPNETADRKLRSRR